MNKKTVAKKNAARKEKNKGGINRRIVEDELAAMGFDQYEIREANQQVKYGRESFVSKKEKNLIAVGLVQEQMNKTSQELQKYGVQWSERLSDVYCLELSDKDVAKIEKENGGSYILSDAADIFDKTGEPIKTVIIKDGYDEYECGFGKVTWYGNLRKNMRWEINFNSQGWIQAKKSGKPSKKTENDFIYTASTNVLSNTNFDLYIKGANDEKGENVCFLSRKGNKIVEKSGDFTIRRYLDTSCKIVTIRKSVGKAYVTQKILLDPDDKIVNRETEVVIRGGEYEHCMVPDNFRLIYEIASARKTTTMTQEAEDIIEVLLKAIDEEVVGTIEYMGYGKKMTRDITLNDLNAICAAGLDAFMEPTKKALSLKASASDILSNIAAVSDAKIVISDHYISENDLIELSETFRKRKFLASQTPDVTREADDIIGLLSDEELELLYEKFNSISPANAIEVEKFMVEVGKQIDMIEAEMIRRVEKAWDEMPIPDLKDKMAMYPEFLKKKQKAEGTRIKFEIRNPVQNPKK